MYSCHKILLVDDELMLLELMEKYLADQGYAITTCASGSDAIRAINDLEFSVVITDLRMGDVNGLTVLHHYKKRFPHGIGILYTGTGRTDTDSYPNVDVFLTKPFELFQLGELLDNLLEE